MSRTLIALLACGILAGCGGAPTAADRLPSRKLGTPLRAEPTGKNHDLPFGQAPPPKPNLKPRAVQGGSFASNRFTATIRAIDARNGTLTLAVAGQERTLPIAPDAFIGDDGPRNLGIPGGIQGLQVGSQVTVATNKVGEWETINLVIVKGQQ
jgi:hypothetical protein